jgi:hypothetical protein
MMRGSTPRVDQTRKPRKRRIGIPAAQTLAESREHIVKQLLVALDDLFWLDSAAMSRLI